MKYVGIDIGTAYTKTVVMDGNRKIEGYFTLPTEWDGHKASERVREKLKQSGLLSSGLCCASTGCGKSMVYFADLRIAEKKSQVKGAAVLFGNEPMNVIDVGDRGISVISCTAGSLDEAIPNHGCAGGTGRFVEVMAGRLGYTIPMMDEAAGRRTELLNINTVCPVYAESDLSMRGILGISRENLAGGVLGYAAEKIKEEYYRLREWRGRPIYLTGGLCGCGQLILLLSRKLPRKVETCNMAAYTGAIGAAEIAMEN